MRLFTSLSLVTLAALALYSDAVTAECNNQSDQAVYASSGASLDNSDTTAEFTWLQTTAGRFTAQNTLSTTPSTSCQVCLYSRLKYSLESEPRRTKLIKCKTARAGRRIVKFKAFAMPGVDPAYLVNLATQTTCGDEVIESNPFGRNPTCGYFSASSSGSHWVRLLSRRVR